MLPYPDNNKVLGRVEYTECQETVLYNGSTSLVPSHASRFSLFPDCHNFSQPLKTPPPQSPHHHGIYGSTAHHVPSSTQSRAAVPYSSSSTATLSPSGTVCCSPSACVPSVPCLAPPGLAMPQGLPQALTVTSSQGHVSLSKGELRTCDYV